MSKPAAKVVNNNKSRGARLNKAGAFHNQRSRFNARRLFVLLQRYQWLVVISGRLTIGEQFIACSFSDARRVRRSAFSIGRDIGGQRDA